MFDIGECMALAVLPCTVSGMQGSRCGHGWRIACAAAVFMAALLLAQSISLQPNSLPRSRSKWVVANKIMVRLGTQPHW